MSVLANMVIARVQFALAGINAHINHDLPEASFYGTLDGLTTLTNEALLVPVP
jgi:hypothetical protein